MFCMFKSKQLGYCELYPSKAKGVAGHPSVVRVVSFIYLPLNTCHWRASCLPNLSR